MTYEIVKFEFQEPNRKGKTGWYITYKKWYWRYSKCFDNKWYSSPAEALSVLSIHVTDKIKVIINL